MSNFVERIIRRLDEEKRIARLAQVETVKRTADAKEQERRKIEEENKRRSTESKFLEQFYRENGFIQTLKDFNDKLIKGSRQITMVPGIVFHYTEDVGGSDSSPSTSTYHYSHLVDGIMLRSQKGNQAHLVLAGLIDEPSGTSEAAVYGACWGFKEGNYTDEFAARVADQIYTVPVLQYSSVMRNGKRGLDLFKHFITAEGPDLNDAADHVLERQMRVFGPLLSNGTFLFKLFK